MTRKKETTFYTGVNNELHELDPEVYFEKMYNPLRGGTPDMYYEHRRNLWVEYKYVVTPAQARTLVRFDVSSLQNDWLTRNYDNGHEPWVIVGTHAGRVPMGVIVKEPREWRMGMTCDYFRGRLMTRKQIAQAILDRVNGEINSPEH
jgi:hypothetical protein